MRQGLAGATLLAAVLLAGGCDEASASPKGYRKEFRIYENQIRLRLELHMAYQKRYPAELSDIEEPGADGFQLPRLPEGYFYDYNPLRGTVQVRAEEDEE